MKNYLKQFTEWGTALRRNLKNNIFEQARIKLTAFYLAGMIIVLGIFTAVLLFNLEKNIRMTYRQNLHSEASFNRALLDTNDGIEAVVYSVDGFFLLLLGVASYALAGRTLRPIKESLEAQKRFSADASHDLRTPLSIIMTESEVMLASKSTEASEYREVLSSVLEEAHTMSKLVEDLLYIARSESGSLNHQHKKILTHSMLESLVYRMQKQMAQKNIHVAHSFIQGVYVLGNEDLLNRAIQNILQNAINYTPTGGTITIAATLQGESVLISISDTGVGIGEKDLPYIFDRFYKAAHSRNDGSGSGLGLPIAKEIIENHNGLITIKSAVYVGTEVSIFLPIGEKEIALSEK